MRALNKPVRRTLILLSVLAAIITALVVTQTGNAVTPDGKYDHDRRHIVLPNRKDTLPFSDGVLVGDTLYLAGRIGVDPETGKPPAELEKEIRLLLDGMKATLAAANMTMDDLVSVQEADLFLEPASICAISSSSWREPRKRPPNRSE